MFEGKIPHHLESKEPAGVVEPPPLTTILGAEELQRLREHFNEEVLRDMALVLGKKLPASNWFIRGIADQFYSPAAYPSPEDYERAAARRESQLITLFLVYSHGQGLFLGIHLYWGLMMGLSPEDLTQQVMLAGVYGGIELLNTGMTTLERTLNLLKTLGQQPDPTPQRVLGKLAKTLGPIMA